MVELFEQVARFGGIDAERGRIELVEGPRHGADGVRTAVVPGVEIPGEEVAFEEVADAELRPDPALFEIAQFVTQLGRSRRRDEFLER